MNWVYAAIMGLAVLTGFVVLQFTQQRGGLTWREAIAVGVGGFCGGMLGAKLPFVLADWPGFLSGTAWLDDGKTIMSGLVGGYLGVRVTEWAFDIHNPMCDRFAVPVAAAIGVGRLACFAGGCCYGDVTSLPWGMDFGDGLSRHPTQLYESAFHLLAAAALLGLQRRGTLRGHLIKVYFVSYFLYRFASEFIRPEPALWLGLTGYQWSALVLIPIFSLWCCPTYLPRRGKRWGMGAAPTAEPNLADRPLKETRTLCPTCLQPVTGITYQRGGKVYLERECAQHGKVTAVVSSDRRLYYLRDEVPHPSPAPGDCCAEGPSHKTCVGLLEVTEACNLRCPICYAQSPGGGHRPAEELLGDLERFVVARGGLEVLQLSGGEPLLHPDLLRIIDGAKSLPIDHVMINTNGLELLRQQRLATKLAERRPRLELYLQLDGVDAESQRTLRGEDLAAQKRAVIAKIIEHNLPTTLVATVARGVNEGQVAELLQLGLETPQIRGITFQPATYAGRFEGPVTPVDRTTLADVVNLLVAPGGDLFATDDFKPLPCSNPNCCSFTYAVRRGRDEFVPLPRVVRYERHLPMLSDRMNFDLADARRCCGIGGRPEDYFRIVIKPFMDAYTYDQDRVNECCVHIILPGGQGMSFCRYNVLERGRKADRKTFTAEPMRDRDLDRI
ncbi:MAG: prolipoprotein diacylglyceryl transferase family protein [Pirellulales bacterium]